MTVEEDPEMTRIGGCVACVEVRKVVRAVEVVTNGVFEVVGIGAAVESWMRPTVELAGRFDTPSSEVRSGEGPP